MTTEALGPNPVSAPVPSERPANLEEVIELRQAALEVLHSSKTVGDFDGWVVERQAPDSVVMRQGSHREQNGRLFIHHDNSAGLVVSYRRVWANEASATVHETSLLLRNDASSRSLDRSYESSKVGYGKILPGPIYEPAQALRILSDETVTDELTEAKAHVWLSELQVLHTRQLASTEQTPADSTRRQRAAQTVRRVLHLS